jgi:general secretion pathway protein D
LEAAALEVSDQEEVAAVIVLPSTEYFPPSQSDTLQTFATDIDPGEPVSVTLVDVSLLEMVDTVLGRMAGRSYFFDRTIEGRGTLRTTEAVTKATLLRMLETTLAAQGVVLIDRGDLVLVVPTERVGEVMPSVNLAGTESGLGVGLFVFPLQHASAGALAPVLQQFVPVERSLSADENRNVILFSGSATEAEQLTGLIDTLDRPRFASRGFALVPLQQADEATVAAELQRIFASEGANGTRDVDVLPIARMHAVLIMASSRELLGQATAWAERLDRGEPGAERQLFVYQVQNGRASHLAEILSAAFSGLPGQESFPAATLAPELTPVEVGTDQPRVDLGLAGASIASLDGEDGAAVEVFGNTGLRIIADTSNNALIVVASQAEYDMIQSALRQFDRIPLQVLIEATIAEVTLNDTLRYGLQYFFRSGDVSATFSDLASGAVASTFPGFSFSVTGNNSQIVLDALRRITDVKVISSPQLMVLNNETARLQVGDEVPIAVQSAVSSIDPAAPIVNSIEFRDTGVILEVSPRVNDSGLVLLDILQEVSDVVPTTTSTIDSPTIQQRSVQSTVAVLSGQTIALGGLIRESDNLTVAQVPLLGDIPIVGELFKNTEDTRGRTELLVLMTPRVVRNLVDIQEVTQDLRDRLLALDAFDALEESASVDAAAP